jgi:hypothetical protein
MTAMAMPASPLTTTVLLQLMMMMMVRLMLRVRIMQVRMWVGMRLRGCGCRLGVRGLWLLLSRYGGLRGGVLRVGGLSSMATLHDSCRGPSSDWLRLSRH